MINKKDNNQDISLKENISPAYQKFFDRFIEIETLEIDKWNTTHILAHLCKKYKEYYNLNYTFKFNNPSPSKSFEIYVIKKIANMISSNPNILKDYIDWVFKEKIIARKKKITSLNYFANTDIVNEYKFKYLFVKKEIKRTDHLPTNITSLCARHGFNISTYAELAFIKKMPNQEGLIQELTSLNFPIDILDKIA